MSQNAYQPGYLKSKNRKLVFDLFAQQNSLSRADIVRLTGMSFPTVSKAVEHLLELNILSESETKATVDNGLGRRGHVLEFNPAAYNALGIEFEGNFAEIGLVDMSGKIIQSKTLRFSHFTSEDEVRRLAGHVKEMQAQSQSPVLGIGIGFPSNVDPHTHEIVSFNTLGITHRISFHTLFAPLFEAVDDPICIENDVNLACMGEIFLQKRENAPENLVFLSLGTGFGAGIILNGHLWQGAGFKAGEIGNTLVVAPNKNIDATPMELSINIQAVSDKFGLEIAHDTVLTNAQRYEIIDFLMPHLVISLYNFVVLLDIDNIVFSGLLPRLLGDTFYTRLQAEVNRLLKIRKRRISIVPPRSRNSVLVGAASMIFDSLIFDQLSM